ncbi:MAG: hypothetical protein M1826_007649 [Phylliscum demangeonii]|nr:MAG: hypothetical protein M1826_007649 [Phylliscum demangeonii]
MLKEMYDTYSVRNPTSAELRKLENQYWADMRKKIERSQSERVSGDALKAAKEATNEILKAARAKFHKSEIRGLHRDWAEVPKPPPPDPGSPSTKDADPDLWRPYLEPGQSAPDFNPPDIGQRDLGPDFFRDLGLTKNQEKWVRAANKKSRDRNYRSIVYRWQRGYRETNEDMADYQALHEQTLRRTIEGQQERNARPPLTASERLQELQARLADLELKGCALTLKTGQLQNQQDDFRQRVSWLQDELRDAVQRQKLTEDQYDAAVRESKRCTSEAASISSEIKRLLASSRARAKKQRTPGTVLPNGPTNAGTDAGTGTGTETNTRNEFAHHAVLSPTPPGPLDGAKTLLHRLDGFVRHNTAFAASAGRRLFSQHHSPAGVSRPLSELRPLSAVGIPEY